MQPVLLHAGYLNKEAKASDTPQSALISWLSGQGELITSLCRAARLRVSVMSAERSLRRFTRAHTFGSFTCGSNTSAVARP